MQKKKKVKREISTGVTIFRYANEKCPFCFTPENLNTTSISCINPYARHSTYESHNIIISCDKNYKSCQFYVEMKKHIRDLRLTKRYVSKFGIKGWIGFKEKHFNWFIEKIAFKTEGYVRGLFSYFGYAVTKDSRTEKYKYLFTNKWKGLAINAIRYDEENKNRERELKEFIQDKGKKRVKK